jgi:hypothetical protein
MANHDHRPGQKDKLPWILGSVSAALMLTLLVRQLPGVVDRTPNETVNDTAATPVTTPTELPNNPSTTATPAADTSVLTRALAADDTATRVDGDGVIDETMPPQSFWLEKNGERMLVVMVRTGSEPEIRNGQHVHLLQALIKRNGDTRGIPPAAGEEVRAAAAKERVYLQVQMGRVTVRQNAGND